MGYDGIVGADPCVCPLWRNTNKLHRNWAHTWVRPYEIKQGRYMTFNPNFHHRRSIRLRDYDYSQAGLYFVTICCHERKPLFGKVVEGEMVLNIQGEMAITWWQKLPSKFEHCQLHDYVMMPNHMHGIIEIKTVGAHPCVRPVPCVCPVAHEPFDRTEQLIKIGQTHGSVPTANINDIPLSRMVQWFKTMTTNAYLRGIKQDNWPSFNGKLWQRNYHEHIIRHHNAYINIAEYIQNNPLRWQEDRYWTD